MGQNQKLDKLTKSEISEMGIMDSPQQQREKYILLGLRMKRYGKQVHGILINGNEQKLGYKFEKQKLEILGIMVTNMVENGEVDLKGIHILVNSGATIEKIPQSWLYSAQV